MQIKGCDVTVQPVASLLQNPAHFKFAFSKGLDSHILTGFAAGAKPWAELLRCDFQPAGRRVPSFYVKFFRILCGLGGLS